MTHKQYQRLAVAARRNRYGVHIMGEDGPLMIFATVLIVSGVQLVALGLLTEIHVRYHYEGRSRTVLEDAACLIRAQNQSSTNTQSKTAASSSS